MPKATRTKAAEAAHSTEVHEQDVDSLELIDFDALLTDAQRAKIEANSQEWGQQRRMALSVLSRSRAQLQEKFEQGTGPDALMDMAENLAAYLDHLKSSIEMAECALARALTVAQFIADGSTDKTEGGAL